MKDEDKLIYSVGRIEANGGPHGNIVNFVVVAETKELADLSAYAGSGVHGLDRATARRLGARIVESDLTATQARLAARHLRIDHNLAESQANG